MAALRVKLHDTNARHGAPESLSFNMTKQERTISFAERLPPA
jgi:hypothetical protein